MRKIGFGLLWFVGLWFGMLVIGGGVAGAIAGADIEAATVAESFAQGQAVGELAGREFAEKYGGMIFLTALVVAIGGSVSGILPGTGSQSPPEQ